MNLRHLDVSHWLDAVIRHVQKDAAQPQEIAGNLEIHDLPLPVLKKLVGTGPARREDIGGLVRLPLMNEIAPRHEGAAAIVQGCQHGKLGIRQGDKCAKLADKWSGFDRLPLLGTRRRSSQRNRTDD
jgi:hypothetical protein